MRPHISRTPPHANSTPAAMTLFYMSVSLGLVLVWMAWRGFLWADKFFMQASCRPGEESQEAEGWEVLGRRVLIWLSPEACPSPSIPHPSAHLPCRCGPLASPLPRWPGPPCCTT
jgi:hypothetical protein